MQDCIHCNKHCLIVYSFNVVTCPPSIHLKHNVVVLLFAFRNPSLVPLDISGEGVFLRNIAMQSNKEYFCSVSADFKYIASISISYFFMTIVMYNRQFSFFCMLLICTFGCIWSLACSPLAWEVCEQHARDVNTFYLHHPHHHYQ